MRFRYKDLPAVLDRHPLHRKVRMRCNRLRLLNRNLSKLSHHLLYTSITGYLPIPAQVRTLPRLLARASRALRLHKMRRLIFAPTIKTRPRNAKQLGVIIHLRLQATNPKHHHNSRGLHHGMGNPRPATSEGGGEIRDGAVESLQLGAMMDNWQGELAVVKCGQSTAVREWRLQPQTGKRRGPHPARRGMNPKCGCEGPDLKLANLATRLDRK